MLDASVLSAFDEDDEDFAEWNDPPSGPFPGPGPVTFPSTPLGARVWLGLGADLTQPPETWPLTDITSYVRHADGISVKTGRQDEASLVPPGEGKLRLDNRDFRFSRRNPNGPYYGLLNQNTPILAVVDPGSGQVPRMQMYVTEWPSRADLTLTDVTVPITCAGILRRLGQGSVLKSPLRRAYQALIGSDDEPTNWWPLEEGPDADRGASGLIGGSSTLEIVGAATFGGTPIGSSGAALGVDFSSGGSLLLPTGQSLVAAPGGWEFECTVAFDTLPTLALSECRAIAAALSSGIAGTMGVGIKNSGGTIYWADFIFDLNGSGTHVALTTLGAVEAGRTYHLRMVGHQDGSGLRITVYVDGDSEFDDGFVGTLMMPTFISLNTTFDPTNTSFVANTAFVAHGAFWNAVRATTPATYLAADGYAGELAHERIARLCTEEGVQYTPTASTSPAMGPQGIDSFLTNLRACEAVDVGVLYERGFGLGYQSRAERYNAAVTFELDFAAGEISEPPDHADDDQRIRNRWTISRPGGGEATVEDADSIALNGLYDDSAELDLEEDSQCIQEAGWLLHLGTVDEERWPRFDMDFASTPGAALIPSWLALEYGARVNVANPPDMFSPDVVDAFIEGREERWNQIDWDAAIYTTPASPYRVNVVGSSDGNMGRVDAASSTLASDVDTVATSITVSSPGALWRTGSVNFQINVAGERMTVTNISGASSPQTFTVVRSVNGVVKSQPALVGGRSVRVSLWNPAVVAL